MRLDTTGSTIVCQPSWASPALVVWRDDCKRPLRLSTSPWTMASQVVGLSAEADDLRPQGPLVAYRRHGFQST